MLSPVAARVVNRLLAADEPARTALVAHVGQTAAFTIPPVQIVLSVMGDGTVTPANADAKPDLRIRLTVPSALRVLAGDMAAAEIADVDGDAAFAATVRRLVGQRRWDLEEGLSRVVGDIAAHRIANTGRSANLWGRDAAVRLSRGAAEYVTEEARILPPRAEVESWFDDVDQLRDAVERLEKRLALLETPGAA